MGGLYAGCSAGQKRDRDAAIAECAETVRQKVSKILKRSGIIAKLCAII